MCTSNKQSLLLSAEWPETSRNARNAESQGEQPSGHTEQTSTSSITRDAILICFNCVAAAEAFSISVLCNTAFGLAANATRRFTRKLFAINHQFSEFANVNYPGFECTGIWFTIYLRLSIHLVRFLLNDFNSSDVYQCECIHFYVGVWFFLSTVIAALILSSNRNAVLHIANGSNLRH